ncbi:MAG: hypothetical protein ABIK92_17540 [Pseudomonadota bacterium]
MNEPNYLTLNHQLCWCDPKRFDRSGVKFLKIDDRFFPQESPEVYRGKGGRTLGKLAEFNTCKMGLQISCGHCL